MSCTPRLLFTLLALFAAGLLAFGYYLQYHDGLEPCPMCIFQRLCFMAVVLIATAAAVHGPGRRGVWVYAALTATAAAVGGGIAARQVWLQHLPAERVPECGPGLEFMLETLPLAEVIRSALRGTGECAVVDWTLFGLSIAEWSLACFCAIVVVLLACLLRRRHNPAGAF